ncbi:MAG: hypothetical protein KF701_09540 [Anaerolineales bacterium]|nr:MAG: hypothetical protein KF701_09540 [Anaerolineales bacterium]
MRKLAALSILAVFLSACGSRPAQAQVVPIELTEFAIDTPISVFKVGTPYRFVISNPGAINHEFVLMSEGQVHDMSGESSEGDHSEMGATETEGAAGEHDMTNMFHVDQSQLNPGNTVTIEHTFTEAGEYEFGCYLPGHYAAGMMAKISVVP